MATLDELLSSFVDPNLNPYLAGLDQNYPIQPTQPEVAQIPTPKLATQDKVNQLQSDWGNKGFKFEIDSKGQMVITNTPETRAAAGVVSPEQAMTGANFSNSLREILNTNDPVERATMMSNLHTQFAAKKQQILSDLSVQAEQAQGVPMLESALYQSQIADKSNPAWMGDSQQTARIRQALLQAKARAANEAQMLLERNVSFVSMQSQLAAANDVYKRSEAKQDKMDIKAFNQEYEAQALVQEMGPELLSRMSLIDPSVNGKTPEEIAMRTKRAIQDPQTKLALNAQADELPALSFILDNEPAMRILAAKESQATGKPITQVVAELQQIKYDMAAPPAEFAKKARALGMSKDDLASLEAATRRIQLGGTKEDILQAKQQRFNLITKAYANKSQSEFLGNTQSWGVADPDIQKAINDTITVGKAPTAQEVLKAYVGNSIGAEAVAKQTRFMQIMEASAQAKNKSLLAPINPFTLRIGLQAGIIAENSFSKRLGEFMSNPAKPFNQIGAAMSGNILDTFTSGASMGFFTPPGMEGNSNGQ